MTLGKLLDFSAGRPAPALIKAAGYLGAITYVPKREPSSVAFVNADYYQQMRNAGLDVGFVYESAAADRDLQGYDAGATDAEWALKQLNNMGIAPAQIYMAHDHHIATGQVTPAREYQRGAHTAIGPLAGAYGFSELIDVVKSDGTAAKYWQTGSESELRAGVHVYQQNYGQVVVGGIQCDVNKILLPDWNTAAGQAAPTQPPKEDDPMADIKFVEWFQLPDGTIGRANLIDFTWRRVKSVDQMNGNKGVLDRHGIDYVPATGVDKVPNADRYGFEIKETQ